MSDAGLHAEIIRAVPEADWMRVETGMTCLGVPDLNGCWGGREVWIENKATHGWKVRIRPAQVGWIEKRTRHGGRCFVAVRQMGAGRDSLWLLLPWAARALIDGARLDEVTSLLLCQSSGGPRGWDWAKVRMHLFGMA